MNEIYELPCNGDNGEKTRDDYKWISENQQYDIDFLSSNTKNIVITTREIPLNINYEDKNVFIESNSEDKLVLQNLNKLGAKNIYIFKNITPIEINTYDVIKNIEKIQNKFKDLDLLDSQEYLNFQDELNKLSIDENRKG